MVRKIRTGRGPELAEVPPSTCPNGHRLGPAEVWVGHVPCGCATDGHRVYECRACGAVICAPPCSRPDWAAGRSRGR